MQEDFEERIWQTVWEKTERGELAWRVDEHRRCTAEFNGALITLERIWIGGSVELCIYPGRGPLRLHASPGTHLHRTFARRLCDAVEERVAKGLPSLYLRREKAQNSYLQEVLEHIFRAG